MKLLNILLYFLLRFLILYFMKSLCDYMTFLSIINFHTYIGFTCVAQKHIRKPCVMALHPWSVLHFTMWLLQLIQFKMVEFLIRYTFILPPPADMYIFFAYPLFFQINFSVFSEKPFFQF